MERIIRDKIDEHLTSSKLLSSSQHDFVRKRSVTNLLETLDYLTMAKANKLTADMVMLDFAKAFDKVPHRRLLLKLEGYGICGDLLLLIEALLSNRKQRVVFEDASSEWCDVTSGVPQGIVLGPILYVVFINDLPECVSNETTFKLFADDSKLLTTVRDQSDRNRFQTDLLEVCSWTRTWLK